MYCVVYFVTVYLCHCCCCLSYCSFCIRDNHGVIHCIQCKKCKKIILYLLVIGFLATISIPVYLEHSTQIQNKFEGGKGEKYGSRSAHFGEGFDKLNESPLIGSGFATAWYRGVLHKGRLESGSGWLSILFQLGALGAIIMLFILKKVTRVFKYIRHDRRLQLFVISLLFCVCILVLRVFINCRLLYRFCILASNFSYNMLSGYGEEVQIKF